MTMRQTTSRVALCAATLLTMTGAPLVAAPDVRPSAAAAASRAAVARDDAQGYGHGDRDRGRGRGRDRDRDWDRDRGWDRGRDSRGWDRGYRDHAIDFGYRDGYAQGYDDARDRDRFDPRRHKDYRKADAGYYRGYGPKDIYRNRYRDAFHRGYEAGFNAAFDRYHPGRPRPRGGFFFGWRF